MAPASRQGLEDLRAQRTPVALGGGQVGLHMSRKSHSGHEVSLADATCQLFSKVRVGLLRVSLEKPGGGELVLARQALVTLLGWKQ